MAKKKTAGPAKSLPSAKPPKSGKAKSIKVSLQIGPSKDPGCSTKSHTLLIANLLSTAQLTLSSSKDVVIEPAGKNGKTKLFRLTFK